MIKHRPVAALLLALTACNSGKSTVDDSGTDPGTDTADTGDTSDTGVDAATGCDLSGKAFVLDFGSATIEEPPNIGPLLVSQLIADLAVKVEAQDDTSIQAIIAFANEDSQEVCIPTAELPTTDWSDPEMSFGPETVALELAGIQVQLEALYLSIDAAEDCNSLTDGLLEAELDARHLVEVVGEVFDVDTADELCVELEDFDVSCETCSSDGAEYCADLRITDLQAPAVDFPLEAISEEDVAANPDCQ